TSAGILDTIMILLAVLEYQITFVSVMSIELFVLLCIFTVWLFRIKKEGLPTLLSLKSSLKRAVKIRINVNFFTFTVFLVILLVVIEFFIFYSALITPVFTVWDALSLYAPYSKIIFLEKTVHWNEWVINGPLPTFEWYPELRNVIMFAVWGYTCNGSINENFAKIISPVFSVMILLLMIQFSKRIFKSTSVALSSAVILFYFSPDFVNRSQYFHVDIPFTFYWFCSTYVAYLFTLHKNWKYAILLGLLTGFTLLAKKVGILFILFLATLYFREILRKRDEKFARRFIGNTKLFMIIIVASAIIAGILYGKVWIVYGNPVYPLLWRFLDGRYIIPFIRETESQIEYEYLSPLSSDWFFLQISRLIRDSGFFFVIFCIIGALLFIKNYGRSDVQLFLMQTLIFISAWYFSGYGPRQLLPLFPFLAIYTGTFFKFEAKMKVKIWKSSSISLNVPVKKLVLVSFLLFSTALSIVFDQAIWQSITVHKYPWLNGFSNGLYLAAKGRNPSILYTFQNFTKPMDVETFSRYNFAFSDLREAWNYLNFKTPPNSTV
ncbi:MAG: glycosyltransferase family 39 protein, partial [Methanosarcinales archaeon]